MKSNEDDEDMTALKLTAAAISDLAIASTFLSATRTWSDDAI